MYNNSNVTTIVFLTSSGSWNTQKAISSLEPSSDVDMVTAMGKAKRQWEEEARTKMTTTTTMRLASGFLDSLSASETVASSTFADRSRRSYSFVCGTVEDRLGIPRICAHSVRTTCADLRRYYARSAIPRQNIPPSFARNACTLCTQVCSSCERALIIQNGLSYASRTFTIRLNARPGRIMLAL